MFNFQKRPRWIEEDVRSLSRLPATGRRRERTIAILVQFVPVEDQRFTFDGADGRGTNPRLAMVDNDSPVAWATARFSSRWVIRRYLISDTGRVLAAQGVAADRKKETKRRYAGA